MASVTSLGIHKPSAIPFLVTEGILSSEPSEDTYTWQTLQQQDRNSAEVEEELVCTEHCVVWSRGGVTERVFRFNVEGEAITQAVFTSFPSNPEGPSLQKAPQSSFTQNSQHKSTQNGELKVERQRPTKPASTTLANHAPGHGYGKDGLHDRKTHGSMLGDRALVVVLKTQAHIFLLSKTSHIIHLPFEVDAVFPSACGILLQRKVPDQNSVQPTPRIPSAPTNTFSYSQSSSSGATRSSFEPPTTTNATIQDVISTPFTHLLKNIQEKPSQSRDAKLPRLFCLIDPLVEIGTVVTKGVPETRNTSMSHQSETSEFGKLDLKERLLYISPQDELGHRNLSQDHKDPLILAVTENEENGIITVWNVSYIDPESSSTAQRVPTHSHSGARSRRRSSYGPVMSGIGTGTTTPVPRSYRNISKDPTFEEDPAHDHENLLDSALGNPTVATKSSRRVSSLLARADLSSNHDRSTFTDLAAGHPATRSGRRGLSSGTHASRLSAGPDTGTSLPKTNNLHGSRTSLESTSLYQDAMHDSMDELDDVYELGEPGFLELHYALRGLRKEIVFQRVYSTTERGEQLRSYFGSAKRRRLEVMTMKAPGPELGDPSHNATVVLSVIDRVHSELLTVQIDVITARRYRQSINSATFHQKHSFRVSSTRQTGVIDACKVSEGNTHRVLILHRSVGSAYELSLSAPWTLPQKIELPSPLNLHDPHQVSDEVRLRKKREGGFRRVISQGPKAIIGLQHGNSEGCVDIIDSGNIIHRVQMRYWPSSPFIRQIIKISEAVLPASEIEGEAMLRGWWDAMSWSKSMENPGTDKEWTAIVIVLFTMGVSFIDDRRTEATPRQKRHKGGLLRSSSGANTDLESWEAMLSQESSSSNTSPQWMQRGAWEWTGKEMASSETVWSDKKPKSSSSWPSSATPAVPISKKSSYLLQCILLARAFLKSPIGQAATGEKGYLPTASSKDSVLRRTALASILVALHLYREELKLDVLAAESLHQLTPLLAQLGTWLGWSNWSFDEAGYYMLESIEMETWLPDESIITGLKVPAEPFPPPSILQYIESTYTNADIAPFTSLIDVAGSPEDGTTSESTANLARDLLFQLTPRTMLVTHLLSAHSQQTMEARVFSMASCGIDLPILETLPESVAACFRTAMSACQAKPPTGWNGDVLQLIGRDDIAKLDRARQTRLSHGRSSNASDDALRDVHTICNLALDAETVGPYDWSAEVDRQSITRLLFREDQRFAEAARLVHPLFPPTAQCAHEPGWSETDLLEAQQELAKVVALRTLAVSTGRGLLFYCARSPLLTEKFPIHGFTLSCIMKPTDTTVTADRSAFVEEKVSWAFFHAGAEAGLSISKDARGVDTSWILFNKPRELTNRHAGFLLALGLNGHLRSIAKWVAFKYLTPKHTMTSIGLLLGLSASYLGTMDTLVTRLLSVHVTRMLPPGAAELNLSPLTQTSGIMGIGLLYCNTQHRRMSEIMLSEMESVEQDDGSHPLEILRDEGYRLAAGFALGYINLVQGRELRGLHDMRITERLLTMAIATKKVNVVHIADKATAGATIAVALIFMKTQDQPLARKIDIPDTAHQFDYMRPDQFLLRTVARHLIMWDNIKPSVEWITKQLPGVYRYTPTLSTIRILRSENMAFFNILAGICLSIGLRFAGSGSLEVRDLLCQYLDQYIRICRLPTLNYDGKLARIAVRNCQDVVALSAACVMAGTGDLVIFRRFRSLHGRTDPDTPYGSHLAAHLGIGILFLGGGTHTFGTSNLAIASLLCTLYPLFPAQVLDNKTHLQAFRHFWVLATEHRCLIPRDVNTHRPIPTPICVTLKNNTTLPLTAPCLLPEISTIAQITTTDPESWTITLDLSNPTHLAAFSRHQSIYIRRRTAYDAHASVFSATMQALNDAQSAVHKCNQQTNFEWIFELPAFKGFDRAARALVLPAETGKEVYRGVRGTAVDDRLVLGACLGSGRSERLWNLRILLGEEGKGWVGVEVVEGLRSGLALRRRGRGR